MSAQPNSKPEPEVVYTPKLRTCLKCTTQFMSAWPGERICQTCKSRDDWRSASSSFALT